MYRYSETSEVRFKYNFNHIQFKTIHFSFFYLKKKVLKMQTFPRTASVRDCLWKNRNI